MERGRAVRLSELKEIALTNTADTGELCGLLEITGEELLDRFADRLLEFKERFGVMQIIYGLRIIRLLPINLIFI